MPKKRRRGGVAQATGVPPNVPTTEDGRPLGVPRNGIPRHARVEVHPEQQMGSVYVEINLGGLGIGGVPVDLGAVLESVFDALLDPEPAAPRRSARRGRGGFKMPPWV
jgi:hypothetical protein